MKIGQNVPLQVQFQEKMPLVSRCRYAVSLSGYGVYL